jgi:hypothetical protein
VGAVPVLAQHVGRAGIGHDEGSTDLSGSRSATLSIAGIEGARIYPVYRVRVYRFAMRGRSSCSHPPRDVNDASHDVAELGPIVSLWLVETIHNEAPALSLLCLLIHL